MGKLAELYAKKAKGELTEAEEKELDALISKMDAEAPADPPANNEDEEDVDKAIEAASQRLADTVQKGMDDHYTKIEKLVEGLNTEPQVKTSDTPQFIVDKTLGKKSVKELADMKVKLQEREGSGKKVTEISERTVQFVKAFFQNLQQPGIAVEKLQILSEGVAADGGYIVPEEWANMIIEDIRDLNIMRQIAAPPIQISTDTFHLPNLASRPKANWRAEKAAKQTSTANFGENVLTPYSLASIVPMTNEFVADAALGVGGSVVNFITQLLATALAEKEEEAFWIGNGTGRPSGVDGGVYSLRTIASGLTDALRADSIIQALFATPQGYRNRGVFVGNSGTWQEIARLKDSQGRYLLSNLADSATTVLRGRPVYESNYLAGGTLLFGDFSYYQIVDREGLSIKVSDEATVAGVSGFEKNITFVRAEKRVDAELVLPAAITKVTGLGTP
jgi:HK97 family phage major capsid protein